MSTNDVKRYWVHDHRLSREKLDGKVFPVVEVVLATDYAALQQQLLRLCGCIICRCENEEQCQGCGARNCGIHDKILREKAVLKQQLEQAESKFLSLTTELYDGLRQRGLWIQPKGTHGERLINSYGKALNDAASQLEQAQDNYKEAHQACNEAENDSLQFLKRAEHAEALLETERMRLAGCGTAALGYYKRGESIHPDYDSASLQDVVTLYEKWQVAEARVRELESEVKEMSKLFSKVPANKTRNRLGGTPC